MNKYLEKDFLIKHNDILSKIMSVPNNYHDRKEDAQIKWVGLIDAFNSLNLKPTVLVDIGAGFSSLPIYFKQTVPNVIAVEPGDLNDFSNVLKNAGVNLVNCNLEESTLQDNYVDVVVDACAMGCSMPLEIILSILYNKLKPGGYLISVGDSCPTQNQRYFASPNYWIETAKSIGYNVVGDTNYIESDSNYTIHYKQYKLYLSRLILQKPVE